ncbi:aldose 1-epimerase [Spirosoma luteum]|uniref:aldose 1-epimerase n=1 Tax=Spirosoma luteum TaxID=431553 RepID=UPI000379D22A|nr:aldose 1-epimerase [Spirosoma luteum]
MPFTITTQPFGTLPTHTDPLIEYVLEHTETGEFLAVIPEFGAVLRRLVLRKGHHLFALIEAPDSPQALVADESYASAFLYPFPSRIRHGIYSFDGEDYALKMNETHRDNALHGFVHRQPFSVVSQEATDTYAQLVLRYDYAGDTFGYPFPFALTVTYQLVQANRLEYGSSSATDRMCALRISYTAQNMGLTRAPAAFGWHPYFTFIENKETTRELVDNLTISLPAHSPIELDENLLPTGKGVAQPEETLRLHERELNNVFLIEPVQNQAYSETVLQSSKTGARLIVGQQTGEGKLNYLVCYTPPRRDSIAIEPLTANVDAFNNGEGLAILDPGGILSGSMWVRLD